MTHLSNEVKERLQELKGYVEEAHKYYEDNYKRFNEFKTFIYASTLSQSDISKLNMMQKPTIEFNTLESVVSHQVGEFDDHEPGLFVGLADGVLPERLHEGTEDTIEVIQGHVSDILYQAKQNGLQSRLYEDAVAGGFSVAKVGTKYINDRSFEQCIYFDKVFDPTLVGFDPLAREPHKGDGRYCFEIIPKTKEEFEEEYGPEITKEMKFTKNIQNFVWSFSTPKNKIVLIADMWLKKRKREKIAKLSNGHVIFKKHYPKLLELWELNGIVEQAPIILEERWTIIEEIERIQFCENQVLKHQKTDYSYLPLVFIRGSSVILKRNQNGSAQEMTRPMVYQAKGVQKLKNFAGQTIASEIESMVENKWLIARESIDEDYIDWIKNPQKSQAAVYRAFYKGRPDQPTPQPREIVRTPMPDIVQQTFMGTDLVTQTILGNFNNQLGHSSNKELSGKAIQQGALQTASTARPFLINYIVALNRVAEIILDLIPKYYVTPRSIPIRKPNGTRDYQIINDNNNPDSITINYRPKDLQVKIEAGANSKVQKQVANETIAAWMGASESFAAFINEECLPIVIGNFDIKGANQLREKAEAYMEAKKQQAAMMASQPSPETQLIEAQKEVEMAKVAQRQHEAEGRLAAETARISIEKQKADTEFFKIMAEIEQLDYKAMRETQELDSKLSMSAIDAALEVSKHGFDMQKMIGESLLEPQQ